MAGKRPVRQKTVAARGGYTRAWHGAQGHGQADKQKQPAAARLQCSVSGRVHKLGTPGKVWCRAGGTCGVVMRVCACVQARVLRGQKYSGLQCCCAGDDTK